MALKHCAACFLPPQVALASEPTLFQVRLEP